MDRRKMQANRARERRLRAEYRRKIAVAVIISLIVGAAAGVVAGVNYQDYLGFLKIDALAVKPVRTTATPAPTANNVLTLSTPTAEPTTEPTAEPTAVPTATPTVAPTAEPTAEPTATPVPAPTATPVPEEIIVAFGDTQTLTAQINADGTARRDNGEQEYEDLTFSLRVTRYLTPEYYRSVYSDRFQLNGDEAGVEFELTLSDYMGEQSIVPQNLFVVGLENAKGVSEQGYQLTDAEIQGSAVELSTNIPTMVYKRFKFSTTVGDMKYLSVTTFENGRQQKYLFELGEPLRPTPVPTAEPTPVPTPMPDFELLEIASRGEGVERLQQKLIDLGYLEGTADGRYGEMTANAVKAAQADFGLEQTGRADVEFQKRLFSE